MISYREVNKSNNVLVRELNFPQDLVAQLLTNHKGSQVFITLSADFVFDNMMIYVYSSISVNARYELSDGMISPHGAVLLMTVFHLNKYCC